MAQAVRSAHNVLTAKLETKLMNSSEFWSAERIRGLPGYCWAANHHGQLEVSTAGPSARTGTELFSAEKSTGSAATEMRTDQ